MKKFLLSCLLVCVVCIFCACSMNNLPQGTLLKKHNSPDGKYVLNTYLVNEGATVDYAVRGELVSEKGVKNIYWDYHIDNAEVCWIDNENVNINGHVLNVNKDVYDYRSDIE